MPQPTADVLEVTINALLEGQKISNVLHFQKEDNLVDMSEVEVALTELVLNFYRPLACADIYFEDVTYRNLFNPSEQGTIVMGFGGTKAGDAFPAHDTLNVSLSHDEPAIRKGRKAVFGMSDDDAIGSLFTFSTISTATPLVSAMFAEPLRTIDNPAVTLLRPVVVKRVAELINGVTRYRLPTSVAEALVGFVYDVVIDVYVRTQNSRKIGRGN